MGATDNTYCIDAADYLDAGSYTCEITNTLATELTLYTRPIKVKVDNELFSVSNGLLAKYYNGQNFDNLIASDTVYTSIDFNWDSPYPGVNSDNFSVKFFGYLYIPLSGDYDFRITVDDVARLDINSITVIDAWDDWGVFEFNASEYYEKGLYPLELYMAEGEGAANISLFWRISGEDEEIIPAEYFYLFYKERLAPTVTTQQVTSILMGNVTLDGLVNPHSNQTTVAFMYGTTDTVDDSWQTVDAAGTFSGNEPVLSLIHISEPTRPY